MISKRRQISYFAAVTVLLIAAILLSMRVGKYTLSANEIITVLSGGEISDMKRNVFLTLRVPRTIMALLAGVGLGITGSIYQIIFKNPLAAPDIIGVASGANLGAALAIVLMGHNVLAMASSAFVGGMLVTLLVMALVRITGYNSTSTYILAGVIMKAVSESFIMIIKFFADPEKELATIEFWSMGSFGNITLAKLTIVLPIFLVGFTGLILMRRQVTLLGLEEDESRMLGVQVPLVRMAVLIFSTLTVTSVICVTGVISFIGLIAPHIARLVLKETSFSSCVFASLCGGLILLLADCFARSIHSAEVPISILTTFIGVPFLIYFMKKRKVGAL